MIWMKSCIAQLRTVMKLCGNEWSNSNCQHTQEAPCLKRNYPSYPFKQNSFLPLPNMPNLLLNCSSSSVACHGSLPHNLNSNFNSLASLAVDKLIFKSLSTPHADIPWCFAASIHVPCPAKYHSMSSFLLGLILCLYSPPEVLSITFSLQAIQCGKSVFQRKT